MFAEAARIRRVVLEVTEACNHRCVHCYNYWECPPPGRPAADTLSRGAIRRLLQHLRTEAPLKQVVISGGEPLTRRDLPGIVGDLIDDAFQVLVRPGSGPKRR
jgi:molybdenum cofactor biosynthesis enzyme MoaA